jgi:hypothetical protein
MLCATLLSAAPPLLQMRMLLRGDGRILAAWADATTLLTPAHIAAAVQSSSTALSVMLSVPSDSPQLEEALGRLQGGGGDTATAADADGLSGRSSGGMSPLTALTILSVQTLVFACLTSLEAAQEAAQGDAEAPQTHAQGASESHARAAGVQRGPEGGEQLPAREDAGAAAAGAGASSETTAHGRSVLTENGNDDDSAAAASGIAERTSFAGRSSGSEEEGAAGGSSTAAPDSSAQRHVETLRLLARAGVVPVRQAAPLLYVLETAASAAAAAAVTPLAPAAAGTAQPAQEAAVPAESRAHGATAGSEGPETVSAASESGLAARVSAMAGTALDALLLLSALGAQRGNGNSGHASVSPTSAAACQAGSVCGAGPGSAGPGSAGLGSLSALADMEEARLALSSLTRLAGVCERMIPLLAAEAQANSNRDPAAPAAAAGVAVYNSSSASSGPAAAPEVVAPASAVPSPTLAHVPAELIEPDVAPLASHLGAPSASAREALPSSRQPQASYARACFGPSNSARHVTGTAAAAAEGSAGHNSAAGDGLGCGEHSGNSNSGSSEVHVRLPAENAQPPIAISAAPQPPVAAVPPPQPAVASPLLRAPPSPAALPLSPFTASTAAGAGGAVDVCTTGGSTAGAIARPDASGAAAVLDRQHSAAVMTLLARVAQLLSAGALSSTQAAALTATIQPTHAPAAAAAAIVSAGVSGGGRLAGASASAASTGTEASQADAALPQKLSQPVGTGEQQRALLAAYAAWREELHAQRQRAVSHPVGHGQGDGTTNSPARGRLGTAGAVPLGSAASDAAALRSVAARPVDYASLDAALLASVQ